ncbi:hypothetical protein MKW98_000543 [Papaver atlanticum]|uniref:Uncharacterized protein n=1 Tax=Papaver atlanticum TaxID=357466 RepID=A0AAD4S4Q2_9MAGN|nr:hypothetical protein MKW98_000543 [Papaver atlanticum]
MATGKLRSSKRNSSSSSSYMSTITMAVFIGLCGLGLWMLTSSSVVPPQSVHTSTNSFSHSDNHHVVNSRKDRKVPSFDDTPGDLPDDAVKEDNSNSNQEDNTSNKSDDDSFMDKTHDELKLSNQDEDSKSSNEDNNEQENNKDGSSSDVNEDNSSSKESAEEEQQQQKQEENQESSTAGDNDNNGNGNENQETSAETNTDTESKDEDQNNQEVQQSHEEQIQQDPEVITTKENTEQTTQQQDPESESKDNPNQALQQESDMDNSQQTQQSDSSSGGGDDNQTQSSEEDNNQQTQEDSSTAGSDENQQQNSQPEIQEVTNDETQSQTQSSTEEDNQQQQNSDTTTSNDETQQTQTNEEEQSQQTTESENQEQQQNSESETSTESNQEETTQSTEDKPAESNSGDSFPTGAHAGIPKESKESNRAWSTQADQSENQKERRKDGSTGNKDDGSMYGYTWELCNVTSGADYIPCLDNEKAIKMLHYTGHFEHRERHCPEDPPTCLVPIPKGYKKTIEWPTSRDKIWYHNVPHTKLAEVKGHQNWVKVTGEFLTFPGGGTQFIHGALHYIDFIQKSLPNIAWGKRTRVILDVGCGVASFGGYLFERDVLAMSFAPKDEHEAQVQFALERGIPAISAVMGSQRLPFPSRVFDLVHCARCRVPWHAEGGRLLLELNRVLRPGGYFVWSATPVYQKLPEDVEIWKAMSKLTISMCWELFTIKKDRLNSVGAAIYRKPTSNECYEQRKHNDPPMCKGDDDANAAWYVPLQACIHRVPTDEVERGAKWPEEWPARVHKPPYWLNSSQKGIYGKPAPEDFATDYEHWKRVVTKSYMTGLGISWSNVRNVMDMRAVYGGFAAALKDIKVWVMNVVNVDSPDTLPIIYERGLFGMYHDWCESFSTYPRTYDLLHADHLFSRLKKRCKLIPVIAEVDRIVRPGGKFIVRDESSVLGEIENMLKSLHWEIHLTFSKDQEGILSAQKYDWRPNTNSASS